MASKLMLGGRQKNPNLVGGSPIVRRTLFAVLLVVLLLVCGAAWYLFRPEKAFIDDEVNEPFPGEVAPGTANPPEHR